MVFQNYALYPNKTVAENLAFGLRQRKTPREEVERRVREMAAMLGLEELMGRRPAQLSGGQRQRVAMGRALVREPQVFLLDEPLSNLDAKLRTTMRAELARLHERLGITTVYVTHDQVEAMTLGQRVAVLRDGVLQQFGDPQVLFHRPVNLFVAAFIGSPTMNLVSARCDGGRVAFAGHALPLPADLASARGDVVLGLRPGSFELAGPWTDPELPRIEIEAELVEALGDEALVSFRVDAPAVQVEEVRTDEGRLLADDTRDALHRARARARRRPHRRAARARARPPRAAPVRPGRAAGPCATPASTAARRRAAAPGTCALAAAAPAARASASGHDAPASSAARKPPNAASPLPTGYAPRRGGTARCTSPVGRRELHAVGAVGDAPAGSAPCPAPARAADGCRAPSRGRFAELLGAAEPERGGLGGVDLDEVGARLEAEPERLAADVERDARAGVPRHAEQPRGRVGGRARRQRAGDADPASRSPPRGRPPPRAHAQCSAVSSGPGS